MAKQVFMFNVQVEGQDGFKLVIQSDDQKSALAAARRVALEVDSAAVMLDEGFSIGVIPETAKPINGDTDAWIITASRRGVPEKFTWKEGDFKLEAPTEPFVDDPFWFNKELKHED